MTDFVEEKADKFFANHIDFSLLLCYTLDKYGFYLRLLEAYHIMKRAILLILALACVLSALALGVSAEETGNGDVPDVENESGSETHTVILSAPLDLAKKFVQLVANAIWRLGDYYRALTAKLGGFARYMPLVLAGILLIFCFFGFRLFRVETVLVGGVAGYAVGYAIYDFLLAWQGHPAFFENWAFVARWVVVGVCAIIGMFVGRLLRRVGVSLVLGLLAASYFSRYTANIWVLLTVFAVVVLLGIVATKPVVIFITSVLGGVAVLNLLIGQNGFRFIDLNAMLGVSVVNLTLLLGILFGLIAAGIQAKTNRGRRYY